MDWIRSARDRADHRPAQCLLSNFERLEIGTSAILRLTGAQYRQFSSGVSKTAGYEDLINLAIDLSPGEELRFSKTAGINSASGALNISGANSAFPDTLAINSDGTVDSSDPNTLISNIENLEIQRGTVILTAEQWNSFEIIKAKGNNRKNIRLASTEGIDLSKFSRSSDSNTTLNLSLTVDQINNANFHTSRLNSRPTQNPKPLSAFREKASLTARTGPSASSLSLAVPASRPVINGTAADDNFKLRLLGPFNISGGEGQDTLTLEANSDISQVLLSSVEILDLNDFNARMGSNQLNSFEQIIGSGEIHLLDSDHFNSKVIAGSNSNNSEPDPDGFTSTDGITIHQPTPGIETIHHFGTADNDNFSGDSSIPVDLTSLTATGSGSVATPNYRWTHVDDVLNINLNVYPSSGENSFQLSWSPVQNQSQLQAFSLNPAAHATHRR